MTAITYTNTHTQIPGWVDTLHKNQQRGYAYAANGRVFHVYGQARGLWTLSTGLTASALPGAETLAKWAQRIFGATNQETMLAAPGEVISGVWRPGLYFRKEVHQALAIDEYAQRSAEQSLRILIEKLDEILLYIEPSQGGLQTYGHKSRELLILACTEVENMWSQYMRLANTTPSGRAFTTNDYVKLLSPLHLKEYLINFKLVRNAYSISPFSQWNPSNPTQSLPWYNAYNKTKHDRELHFPEATLENCFHAIAAAIVMFCVRHGPFSLVEGGSTLAGLFIQHFDISLENPEPKSFYIPAFNAPSNIRSDLFCGSMTEHVAPWQAKPLII
jgi:hypothetical protein